MSLGTSSGWESDTVEDENRNRSDLAHAVQVSRLGLENVTHVRAVAHATQHSRTGFPHHHFTPRH